MINEGQVDNTAPDESQKNEVFAAYHELLRKLKETQTSTPEAQEAQIIEERVVEEQQQIVEEAVQATSPDLSQEMLDLKTALCHAVDEVGVRLQAEEKKFSIIQQAIAIQSKNLEELYKIKPAADTLAALLKGHKEKVAELEQEIAQRRRVWKKEQEDFELLQRNQQAQLKKEQARDEEERAYKRSLLRQLEDELRTRETKIAARENEFEQLKERVNQFPTELQRVAAETEKNITEKLQIKYELETKLAAKDFDTERKTLQQVIAACEAKIKHLESSNYAFRTISIVPQDEPIDKLY